MFMQMGDDYMEDICANIKVHIGFAIPGIKFCSVNNVQMKNEVVFGVAAGRRALRGWTVKKYWLNALDITLYFQNSNSLLKLDDAPVKKVQIPETFFNRSSTSRPDQSSNNTTTYPPVPLPPFAASTQWRFPSSICVVYPGHREVFSTTTTTTTNRIGRWLIDFPSQFLNSFGHTICLIKFLQGRGFF
ncbi:hypothetical protein E3N88_15394 [Mikania micrantha]|uniref:Uncharacterized protein n=1 Tax=Mikania micrantha TaxID=192012 RepID=A0A5N6NVI0_9ASTR|nr:hypothetical protein E3N88_15394 [Mikania micrantha]